MEENDQRWKYIHKQCQTEQYWEEGRSRKQSLVKMGKAEDQRRMSERHAMTDVT